MKIVLLGVQGSGKGTQAKLIAEKYHVPHISTGDEFRRIQKEDSELGRKVREILNHGHLVPDDLTDTIVKKRLSEKDCKEGYILDGYPRNLHQAKYLDSIQKIDYALEVNIRDTEAIHRLSSRRNCSKCGRIYNLYTNAKPKKDELCDSCGIKLTQREDDKPEAIKKRLELYKKETEPVIQYYRNKHILYSIDGKQDIEKIFKEIQKILR